MSVVKTLFFTLLVASFCDLSFGQGGTNNTGGGGLSGAKCGQLFPNCDICSPGFKSCEECTGDLFEDDGICKLNMDFDHFKTNDNSGVASRSGVDYAFDWTGQWAVANVPVWVDFLNGAAPFINTDLWEQSVISGPKVMFTPRDGTYNGFPIGFSSDEYTFSVYSLYVTSVYREENVITFVGYRSGQIVTEMSVTPGASTMYVDFSDEFTDIDSFNIIPSDMSDLPDFEGYSTTQFAIDDILVSYNGIVNDDYFNSFRKLDEYSGEDDDEFIERRLDYENDKTDITFM